MALLNMSLGRQAVLSSRRRSLLLVRFTNCAEFSRRRLARQRRRARHGEVERLAGVGGAALDRLVAPPVDRQRLACEGRQVEDRDIRGDAPVGEATLPGAETAATSPGGVAGAACKPGDVGVTPRNRTILRTFAETGFPSRSAGSNIHFRAASIAARSSSGLTLDSISISETVPSALTSTTTGTTTSCVSGAPAGQLGAG